jgi:CubicO group peptidase (beta-lactamase class C family)
MVLFGLVLGTWGSAQTGPPVVPEDVKTAVRQRVDYGYCPGLVVGLMNTNGSTFFKYGSTELDNGWPVDENTLFEIGSVTKVFTTTLLADMVQRGELELTNAIQPYLPEGIEAPTRSGRAITLTQLATHTSGLPSAPSNLMLTTGDNPFAGYSEQQMYEFLDSYILTRNPGVTYEYSNYGMGLLGQLLARHAQSSYEDLIVTWIADELGLADTRIDLTAGQQARLARGYSGVVPIPPFEMTALEAAGDLRSTAKDLMAFLAANRGWMSTRLQAAMTAAQRSRYSTSTSGLSIGLGWHLYSLNAGTAIWHNGATIGHRAFVGFLRDGATLVVVLANSDYDVTDMGLHLLDVSVPMSAVRQPASVSESTLRRYVGRYAPGNGEYFTIGLLRAHLTLQYSADMGRTFTLYPSGATRFYLTFPEATGTFLTNSSGGARALTWTQSGATSTSQKVRLSSRLSLSRTNGMTELILSGDTDRNYIIQASTDLSHWTDIATNTIWDGPLVDTASKNLNSRFYRVLEP